MQAADGHVLRPEVIESLERAIIGQARTGGTASGIICTASGKKKPGCHARAGYGW